MKTHSKRSRITSVLLSMVLLMTIVFTSFPAGVLSVSAADGDFAGGSGTSGDPYIIKTAAQLNKVRKNLKAHYKLGDDIDLTDYLAEGGEGYAQWGISGWEPIGNDKYSFTGSFDGAEHKISGLWVIRSYTIYVGLFGSAYTATIKNLGVEIDDSKGGVIGNDSTGGLAGKITSSSIANCYVTGSVSARKSTGGLVGLLDRSSITDSYATGRVYGSDGVGGLVGNMESRTSARSAISTSYATGSVSGGYHTGGLVGFAYGDITNSYSTCDVNGSAQYTGGLVGYLSGEISSCYSAGTVTGWKDVGGFLGTQDAGKSALKNCYVDKDISGQTNAVAGGNGSGVKGVNTYIMSGNGVSSLYGFDFNNTWKVQDNSTSKACCVATNHYPQLKVFANSSDGYTKNMSQISTIATIYGTIAKNETPFFEGDGSPGNPYKIYTAGQLNHMRAHNDKNYQLCSNIYISESDFGSDGWKPIIFTGNLDGGGYKITGLYINRPSEGTVGLFSHLYGSVSNLGIVLGSKGINGGEAIGGLAGYSEGTITDCYVNGAVSGAKYVGGLVGFQAKGSIEKGYATGSVNGTNTTGGLVGYQAGIITNSYATGSVSGADSTGGLVGDSRDSIINSYATGSVSGSTEKTGGLVGYQAGSITNSYATGSVTGAGSTGGLVGDSKNIITNSYATGIVTGSGEKIGGLVGSLTSVNGTITNCYATGSVTGSSTTGGLAGYMYQANKIQGCYATGSVNDTGTGVGAKYTGGLIGRLQGGTVTESFSTGSVTGDYRTGGLVGWHNSGDITDCYAKGNVTGATQTGGLVGWQTANTSIDRCYAAGTVSGLDQQYGGFIGNTQGNISNSYYDMDASGQSSPGLNAESVTGLTTAEMVSANTLTTSMANLGSSKWKKRDTTNEYCYYPELKTFYGDGTLNSTQQKASEESVRVVRDLQSVGSITAPAAITSGQSLTLSTPAIKAGTEIIKSQGWQISSDGSKWTDFDPASTLTKSYNGYSLRYYAENEYGEFVYSNTVTITVNKCSPSLNLAASQMSALGDPAYPKSVTLTATLTGADNNQGKSVQICNANGDVIAEGTTDASGVVKIHLSLDAGTYTYMARFNGDSENNSAASTSIDFTFSKESQTITFAETDPEQTYSPSFSYSNTAGGGDGTGEITYAITGGDGVAEIDKYSGTITNVTKSGTIIVTATKAEDKNYNSAMAFYTLTINKADQTLNFAEVDPVKTYSTDFSYINTASGTGKGDIIYAITDDGTGVASITAGTGEITNVTKSGTIIVAATIAEDDNYNSATANYTLTINKADRSLSIKDVPVSITYGDIDFILSTSSDGTGEITWSSNNASVATVDTHGNVTIVGAGKVKITATQADDDNYNPTEASVDLTINKAMLTVTAGDATRKYSEANPEFSVSYDGFVKGDNETALTTIPTVTCTADENSEVGEYAIILSGGEAANYDFVYVNGTLTVTADTSELENAIEEAENLNEGDYTEESWKALQDALDAAKETLNKEGVTQAEVEEATQTLIDAIDALIHVYQFVDEFDTFKGTGSVNGTVNAPYDKFVRLLIDGEEVGPSNYTIADGSTVITLSESYLKTLKNGSYTITAEFTDGSATATLNINVDQSGTSSDKTDSSTSGKAASTGDSMIFPLVILLAAGLSLLFVAKKKYRK